MSDAAASNRGLADEMEVIRVVDDVDNTVDSKDWEACRVYFLDEIDADFTSLAGGSPGRMKADDLVGGWETNLYSEKKSLHMRTNHKVAVDGDEAEVFSKGYALNILHTLRRVEGQWKVSGMSLFIKHARGNERARDFVPRADS